MTIDEILEAMREAAEALEAEDYYHRPAKLRAAIDALLSFTRRDEE